MSESIRRIHSIAGFRAMSRWLPGDDLEDFAKLNLVYGVNASGKTTFSDLLRDCGRDDPWTWQLTLTADSSDGDTRQVSSQSDPLWGRVLVFNESYVADNLEFDAPSGTRTTAHLTLGEDAIDLEKRRAELELELEGAQDSLEKLVNRKRERENELKALVKDTATSIGRELGQVGGRFNPRSYNAGTLRPVLDGLLVGEPPRNDEATPLESDLQVVQQQAMATLIEPDEPDYHLAHHRSETLRHLEDTPTSVAIDELIHHAEANRWVQAGIPLHEDRDTCYFCEGQIDSGRRTALLEHFDDSLDRLQSNLKSDKSSIDGQVQDLRMFAQSLPDPQQIATSQRSGYEDAVASLWEWITSIQGVASELSTAIEAKLDQLFEPVWVELPEVPASFDFATLTNPISEHNQLMERLETNRKAAAKRVEIARAREILSRYHFLRTLVEGLKRKISFREGVRRSLDQERRELSTMRLDSRPIASELTSDLGHLFGHKSLEFMADGGGYKILRNGAPATKLSEGERNAIALLHFLKGLRADGTDLKSSIVVIDDPVSSTDQNITIGLSAQIWATVVREFPCTQVFLLTHNFDVFKLWLNASNNALRSKSAQAFEFRTSTRSGDDGVERIPRLVNLGGAASASRMRSEYHYLFERVASIVKESREDLEPELQLEASCILPNVARRLLEGFLGFRDPTRVGNLADQVDNASSEQLTPAIRRRVRDFVHAYSHHLEADPTGSGERPEAIVSLRAIVDFMRAIDPDHVTEMLQAVRVDLDNEC